jgi:ribosomal protein S27E
MFTLNNITKSPDLRGYFVESKPCPMCGYSATVYVSSAQMFAYNQGAYIHDVLPNYDFDTRERFISGYCGDCWNTMFSFDEDED